MKASRFSDAQKAFILKQGADPLQSRFAVASFECTYLSPVGQWLAQALPYRRFAEVFVNTGARLGADAVRQRPSERTSPLFVADLNWFANKIAEYILRRTEARPGFPGDRLV
jgi:hypothetical protein